MEATDFKVIMDLSKLKMLTGSSSNLMKHTKELSEIKNTLEKLYYLVKQNI